MSKSKFSPNQIVKILQSYEGGKTASEVCDFSQHKPDELKIIVIDNASFHSTNGVELPKHIKLLPIPPYSPELNPAEKIWQWMKAKTAMKIYDTIDTLSDKIEELIKQLNEDVVKSITGYKIYTNAFYSNFKD